jgi:hypothetical protein
MLHEMCTVSHTLEAEVDLYAPLKGLMDAADAAAEIALANVSQRFLGGDRNGFELSSRIAGLILDIRVGTRSLMDSAQTTTSPPINELDSSNSAPFTPASGYAPYLLLGFSLLGGESSFRAAQGVMFAAMELDGALLDGDRLNTDHTGSPRYLAQSGSHRKTMERRGYIASGARSHFRLTVRGREHLDQWLAAKDRTLASYSQLAPARGKRCRVGRRAAGLAEPTSSRD